MGYFNPQFRHPEDLKSKIGVAAQGSSRQKGFSVQIHFDLLQQSLVAKRHF